MISKFRLFALAGLATALVSQPALAQKVSSYPPIYVMGEDDDSDILRCGTNYAAALAAATAALRAGGAPIGTEQQALDHEAQILYLNINMVPITFEDGEDTGSCAGNVAVTLSTFDWVQDPVTDTRRFATLEYCNDGFQFTLMREVLNDQMVAQIREKVTNCLAAWDETAE